MIRGIDIIVYKGGGGGGACPQLDASAVVALFERNLQQPFVPLVCITCRGDTRVLDTFDVLGFKRIDVAHGRGYAVNEYHGRSAVDAQQAVDRVGCKARQRKFLEQLDGGCGGRGFLRGRVDYGATVAHRGGSGCDGYCLKGLDVRQINLQVLDVVASIGYHDFGLPVSDSRDTECRSFSVRGIDGKGSVDVAGGFDCRRGIGFQLANGAHDGCGIVLGQY
ncbi:unknown [Prevotella sp. CAG:873]|nr:unknown [Prevotella sp. CAG:873]